MTPLLLPLLLLPSGCTPPETSSDGAGDTAAAPPLAVADLRSGDQGRGRVDVADVRLVSGLTLDRQGAWLQDRTTGEGAELKLGTTGVTSLPPVGTPVTLRAYFDGSFRAPTLWLTSADGLQVDGPVEAVDVREGGEDVRTYDLARFEGVTVTSQPDPTGLADTSVHRALVQRFPGTLPELGNAGTLTGIVLGDGAVTPRADDDWSGPREPGVVLDTTVDAVLAGQVPLGAMVRLDVVQATPWTRDGRSALVQDARGRGLWLDTEGFGHGRSTVGDLLHLRAEVRGDGALRWLRSWWNAVTYDTATPVVLGLLGHGAVVDVDVSGFQKAGWIGERGTDQGWLLDDRFVDLATLADPARVRAAVDASGPTLRLAVFQVFDAP